MKILLGTLLCSFLLLAAAATDTGSGGDNLRARRHTYNEHTDNSIKIDGFGASGSISSINIGHGNRYKKDVEQAEAKMTEDETLSRVKRWGLFGAKSNVENHHRTHNDNSIHMNGANFGGASNVVVGHNNRLSKRSVDGQENLEEEELSRQKRWSFKGKSNVGASHHSHTDNSIHMNHANFGNSQSVVIGHNNRLSKRSAEGQDSNDRKKISLRDREFLISLREDFPKYSIPIDPYLRVNLITSQTFNTKLPANI